MTTVADKARALRAENPTISAADAARVIGPPATRQSVRSAWKPKKPRGFVRVQAVIPVELNARLVALAERNEQSVSDVVMFAIAWATGTSDAGRK